MRFTFSFPCVCLFTFSLVQIIQSKSIQHENDDKIPDDPKIQQSNEIDPSIPDQDHMIAKLRQNTFKALQKLTENWEIVPKNPNRNGKQLEKQISRQAEQLQAISTVSSSLDIATTVIQGVVGLFNAAFGGSFSKYKARFRGEKNPQFDTDRNSRVLNINIGGRNNDNDLQRQADSLRYSTYADQLTGVLNILIEQQQQQNPNSRIKREMIKSTVDSMLDVYVATHGKTQALLLPRLLDGIPMKKN